jgi:hypothetical protein
MSEPFLRLFFIETPPALAAHRCSLSALCCGVDKEKQKRRRNDENEAN